MAAAKLYVIPGSHACRAGMLMLDHKGLPYQRVDLITVALLMYRVDLEPQIASRPAGALVDRVLPA